MEEDKSNFIKIPCATENHEIQDRPTKDNSEFYPELPDNFKVYDDKFSFLGDNIDDDNDEIHIFASHGDELPHLDDQAEESVIEGSVFAATELNEAEHSKVLPDHWAGEQTYILPNSWKILGDSCAEHYNAGMIAQKNRNWEESLVQFTKCINLKPKESSYYANRGDIYLHLCDMQSAIINYKHACILAPSNKSYLSKLAFIYLMFGQILFDQELFVEALEAFTRAAELDTEKNHYQNRSLACLAALHRHGECLTLVNIRLENDPENCDLLVLRARLNDLFRNYSLCFYDLRDAISIDPKHSEALKLQESLETRSQDAKNKAIELALMRRTREANNKISLAIEMNPTIADYHVKRGAFQRRLGNYNEAIDDLLLAMDKVDHNEESPVYKDAQHQLVLAFNDFAVESFHKGYYNEAIILLNKAIKSETNEKGLYINRGDCFYKLSQYVFALEDFLQAHEMDPLDKAIQLKISLVYHQMGQKNYTKKDYTIADKNFTDALSYNPTQSFYWLARARTRYMMNEIQGSKEDIVTSLLLDPNQNSIFSLISRIFPGKTINDLLFTKLAEHQKTKIFQMVENLKHPPAYENFELSDDETDLEKCSHRSRSVRQRKKSSKRRPKTSSSIPSLKSCITEQEMDVAIIIEKQVLAKEMDKIFNERKSFRKNVNQLCPLKPPLPYTRQGVVYGQDMKEVYLTEQGSLLPVNKGWYQFKKSNT